VSSPENSTDPYIADVRYLALSLPQFTSDVYTDIDPVLRQAINILPAADWL